MTIDGVPIVGIASPTLLVVLALLVITERLVWHKRLDRETARADKWEARTLELLGVATVSVHAAEVSAEAISRLPDPGAQQQEAAP